MPEAKVVTIGESELLKHTSAPKPNPKSGEPHVRNWTYFDHSSGDFKAGIWDSTAGSWEHSHPNLEFCYIVEGSVKIIEKDGPTHVYNAGDSFVVPKGTPVTWVVDEYAKKIFVSASTLEGV